MGASYSPTHLSGDKGDPWELEGSSPRTEGFALSSFERTVKTKIQTVYYHERYYEGTYSQDHFWLLTSQNSNLHNNNNNNNNINNMFVHICCFLNMFTAFIHKNMFLHIRTGMRRWKWAPRWCHLDFCNWTWHFADGALANCFEEIWTTFSS